MRLCERADRAGLQEAERAGVGGDVHVDLALDQRGHDVPAAAIGDRQHLRAGAEAAQHGLACQMRAVADANGCIAQAARALANQIQQFREGLRRQAGAHDEDMIILGLACHLLETLPYRAPVRNTTQTMEARGIIRRQPTSDWQDSSPADF